MPRSLPRLPVLLACLLALLALAAPAAAAPLAGSGSDTGDGNQDNGVGFDWQGAQAAGTVKQSADANDDCFVGGVKELAPSQWAFNTSAGGCTPGKSNLRVAFVAPESTAATTFGHFAFFRNDTTGNSFLTFELNQGGGTWTNATGTAIPCRSNGDVLLSFEVGGSSLTTSLYKWTGDGSGPAACPNGASGTFVGSGTIPAGRFQGAMNAASAITNYVDPARWGASFPANAFGEAAIDLPAVLAAMGQSPCFGFLQMQVHSRSSSSISSAMIDYTSPTPVYLQSCSITGTTYQDSDGDGTRDAGEPGLPGFRSYVDADRDGTWDADEPSGVSDASGFYRILGVTAGTHLVRQVPQAGWRCSAPAPCEHTRSMVTGGNATGADFGNLGPSTASGTAFEDSDGDGVQDAGEGPLAGAEHFADYDDDGVKDAGEPSGTSDASGAWTITGIAAGTWPIRPAARAGWTCSHPASPCASTQTFSSGSAVTGLVFGQWRAATIAGSLFEDLDGDGGTRAPGDPVLAGWQVYLDADGDDAFDFGETATTTDAAGEYTLAGLAPGPRVVRVTPPSAAWLCARPARSAAGCERALTLTSGQAPAGQDFGFTRAATVSGTSFEDTNGDGDRDSGEPLAGDFAYWLDYDADGVQDGDEPAATSDAAGAWTLTGARPGSWTLRAVPRNPYACTAPTPCSYPVTLTSGGASAGNVFGYYTARSVSGRVFKDEAPIGAHVVGGEPGLAGWVVFYDVDKDGVKDAGETETVTNANGEYRLTGLANGSYQIGVVAQSGWTCSFPDSTCVIADSMGANAGAMDADMDFGAWGPSTVSGTVYEDLDGDGATREAGEGPLAGHEIYVDSVANGVKDPTEASALTGADGRYQLTGLLPGTYTIRQAVPAGWTCTVPASCSWTVTVSSSDVTGRDFAARSTGQVTGRLYEDVDADGDEDAGEGPLGGRPVFLDLDGDGGRDAGEPGATTAGDGAYTFSGLAPGAYTVRQELPEGWPQSGPAGGRAVVVVSRGVATAGPLASYTTGSIAGAVFEDADFEGDAREAGDTGIGGRTVFVDRDDDGVADADEPAVTTAPDGAYAFPALAPGTYVVRAAKPATWACGAPATCARTIVVGSRGATTGADFGSYLGAAVSGAVYEDADASGGGRQAGDAPVAGLRVYLDGDGNATRDAGEPTALTGADGAYAFAGVTATTWTVRLDVDGTWTCDDPAPLCAHALTLQSSDDVAGRDFGVHGPGSIAGHLFTDRDADRGPQVFGENDQPGRTVWLDDGDGERESGERTATTDERGDFRFTGVAPGTYEVRPVLPAGWICSTPSPCVRAGVTVASRQEVTGLVFSSYTTASFSGTYFEDADADGDFVEPGEAGLAGRDVYLDLDGDAERDGGEPVRTTGPGGAYSFSGLAPGTYRVRSAEQPADWSCSYPATCAETLTLEAGEAAQDVLFGAWTDGTVAGAVTNAGAGHAGLGGRRVYVDADGDDSYDAGEPSTLTADDGRWSLTLAPGTYTIRHVVADGWDCVAPAGCERAVTVVSQGAVTGADFEDAVEPGSVSGTVFEDADGDGERDAGEPAATGLDVHLDLDADGARDAGEPVVTPAADGTWSVAGLVPGSYVARLVVPADWTCSAPESCGRPVTVAAGQDVTGVALGAWRGASLSGRVTDDLDADGAVDAGEPGRGATDVWVDYDGDGAIDAGEPRTTTAPDGTYALTGAIRPGTWTVRIDAGPGRSCSAPADCAQDRTFTSGGTAADAGAATWTPATVGGRVADDRDEDGIADAGEPGLGGHVVWLDADDDGEPDAGEPARTTAADGTYVFAGLRPGPHVLRLRGVEDRECSGPAGCRRAVALSSGETLDGQDFASKAVVPPAPTPAPTPEPTPEPTPAPTSPPPAAVVAGTLFEDRDADGRTRAAGEPSLAGWTVYADLDDDGRLDAGEPTATTDVAGAYRLGGLGPGRYTLRFLPASDAWVCSLPAGCARTLTVGPGGAVAGQDFAAWRKARITGRTFEDADGDGSAREAGDRPLTGWTVYVDRNRNGRLDPGEPSDVVDEDGRYGLTNLPLGTLLLRKIPPAGSPYRCTYPAGGCVAQVRLVSGDPDTVADFGAVKGIRTASRRARIAAPATCQTGRFVLRVRGALARRVELLVDGRRRAASSRAGRVRYAFALDARRFAPGAHRVLARVTFLDGSTRAVRATFHRCRPAAPRYTG